MSTAAQAAPPSSQTHRRPRHRRRPNRGESEDAIGNGDQTTPRRGGGAAGRGAATQLTPMSVPPPEAAGADPTIRGRGRGRGRGGSTASRGRRQNYNNSRTANGRTFGGQLTEVTEGVENNGSLSANAPVFIPGQTGEVEMGAHKVPLKPPQRRGSKSTASDIATRIHEDIDHHEYECAICTNEVLRNSKVWSCRTCWTVFHISCIKKWANNQSSTMAQQQPQGDDTPARQWRCPGCNLPKDTFPKSFTCWCEKEHDPKSIPGLPPFSCGQTCSKDHVLPKSCPHPCSLMCHAGPCPPCKQIGPTQSCFCGKQSATRRCVDTQYNTLWSCGQVCGRTMACGEHVCSRPCHEGPCGMCETRVDARCYCGSVEKAILCFDQTEHLRSDLEHVASGQKIKEEWVGKFDCRGTCDRNFDCGIHQCSKGCHPQDGSAARCPKSPDIVRHCPCGKTLLQEIFKTPRTSCQDPIPNCDKPCGKTLACGHLCKQVCHTDECLMCLEHIDVTCRCARTTHRSICHQGESESPQCMRICRATLNCGRHECGEHCCPGERKAVERSKRKARPLDAPRPIDDGFEAEHICTRPCGRPLKCGNHTCQELCHKGRCGTCREAIFDEISCNCGRTVLQPPLPCGTKPPPCRFACDRSKACGHPQVPHNCHLDDENCPKCPFLTNKTCSCGRNVLKNQPCWVSEVHCGEVCGKKLKCGAHKCRKVCHADGACEDATSSCQQPCGKGKSCGHPCSEVCHSPFACKEEKPCSHKIIITCPCQHLKKEARCGASKGNEGNAKKELDCNDECGRLARNRILAAALDIDPDKHTNDHIPYTSDTLNMYLSSNVQWTQAQERELRLFAADPERKRLRFKPMQPTQRAFIHSLAEDFGFDSESLDPQPHRHVLVFKTPKFVAAPMKTLAECARIRQRQRAAAATVPVPTATEAKQQKPSNTVGNPFNGFVLTNPRFALTIDELRTALRSIIDNNNSGVLFDISFLPSEEVVLRAVSSSLAGRDLDMYLKSTKPALAKIVNTQSLGKIELCRLDSSLNIERRESDTTSSGGWSQVAAKAANTSLRQVHPARIGGASSFTVLSLSTKKKEEKPAMKKEESVVDDWETAAQEEEAQESRAVSGHNGDESANDEAFESAKEDAEVSPVLDV